jgi:acyl-coenzyme A synthetase/AMP-(fatty) acid ligase
MSGPTPGPWVAHEEDDKQYACIKAGRTVVVSFRHFKVSKEDARLMAAAPALLKVAKDMLRRVADENVIYGPDHVVTATRAAIAAATGEPK